jgi:NADPH:quinone reductase-like Zn-dependent oxidoreductase
MYGDMTLEARVTGLGGGIDGVLQEYRIVPGIDHKILASTLFTLELSLVKIPDWISFEEASTLPCAGVTVWVDKTF